MALTKTGREIPDPKPIAVPAKLKRHVSLSDQINQALHIREYMKEFESHIEPFEQMFDFGPDDDDDAPFSSPYEELEQHAENIQDLIVKIKIRKAKKLGVFPKEKPKQEGVKPPESPPPKTDAE